MKRERYFVGHSCTDDGSQPIVYFRREVQNDEEDYVAYEGTAIGAEWYIVSGGAEIPSEHLDACGIAEQNAVEVNANYYGAEMQKVS